MNRTHFKPHPPNKEGKTNCVIRWMMETPSGWVGSWDKAALEQFVMPADEPYGWKVTGVLNLYTGEFAEVDAKAIAQRIGGTCTTFPLYTRPQPIRKWVGLTNDEIYEAIWPLCTSDNQVVKSLVELSMDEYRAIEKALKEKNT